MNINLNLIEKYIDICYNINIVKNIKGKNRYDYKYSI